MKYLQSTNNFKMPTLQEAELASDEGIKICYACGTTYHISHAKVCPVCSKK